MRYFLFGIFIYAIVKIAFSPEYIKPEDRPGVKGLQYAVEVQSRNSKFLRAIKYRMVEKILFYLSPRPQFEWKIGNLVFKDKVACEKYLRNIFQGAINVEMKIIERQQPKELLKYLHKTQRIFQLEFRKVKSDGSIQEVTKEYNVIWEREKRTYKIIRIVEKDITPKSPEPRSYFDLELK